MTTAVSSQATTTEVAVIPLVDVGRCGNVRQEFGDIESLAESGGAATREPRGLVGLPAVRGRLRREVRGLATESEGFVGEA
ncbi:MAG: hypothetical protein JF886_00135 [Candidatus Dormibacteraeota bacterium]|uniref:Uncharacterized protein n=1 Tax=Candidatus Aeolococcus gillhamiae TaxID=3127015 RepID=A0A934JXQ6_9BACT|nr:hypothetical protein [Candidatus Dormibacteraeota bacterium]